jgi:hypothetical protein
MENWTLIYATYRNSQTTSSGINTKKAAKRRKTSKPPKRVKNPTAEAIKQIARQETDCIVADKDTESRLRIYGPPTDRRYDGTQFLH